MIRNISAAILVLLLASSCAHAEAADLPPPLDPVGAWFCCDAAGACAIATTSCGPGEILAWCKSVGTDAATGLPICLD